MDLGKSSSATYFILLNVIAAARSATFQARPRPPKNCCMPVILCCWARFAARRPFCR
jgi:hypothetical protein